MFLAHSAILATADHVWTMVLSHRIIILTGGIVKKFHYHFSFSLPLAQLAYGITDGANRETFRSRHHQSVSFYFPNPFDSHLSRIPYSFSFGVVHADVWSSTAAAAQSQIPLTHGRYFISTSWLSSLTTCMLPLRYALTWQ